MESDDISVISIQDITDNENEKAKRNEDDVLGLKHVIKAIGLSVFGIIGFSLLFSVPWTTIPRTNSIIFQTYWMESLFLLAIYQLLTVGATVLNLTTWLKEESLMSIGTYLKMYCCSVIILTICYILCYAIWSVYLQYNHPMPNLNSAIGLINALTLMIEIWCLLPAHLLRDHKFRQKLRTYTIIMAWLTTTIAQNQFLIFLFGNFPAGFQFPVAFVFAAFRELDKQVHSRLVKRMMGNQDEPAAALLTINVSSRWSLFITIRLVGAEFATLCCTLAIDFLIHMGQTYKSIKENKIVNAEGIRHENTVRKMNIIKLILTELIEGFTPIIYGASMAMAYYGPNAHIFSNVGNTYWSKEITDIGHFFLVLFGLFAFDTLSALINSFCLWKIITINIFHEFCRVLEKYWLFIGVKLSFNLITHFSSNDVNGGMDKTKAFQWISDEGWMDLVNRSSDLTNEEKAELLAKIV